ncbi:MAG: YjjG family noncanonical pyrimidine nucleotidase [Clostridia bacterium]|nr:YjjG family noncanonical pyrimidine nucleotidase [Clostridia bacterium]
MKDKKIKTYKYLLWDIDGTVLNFLASERYAIRTLFKKYNLGECSDEMLKTYSQINSKYWQKLETGELTKPEILVGRFSEFFEIIGADVTVVEDFNRDYQVTLGDHIEFVDNALEILLSQKGKYIIAAVTNGTKVAQEKKLRLSGLDEIFDYIFISENVGAEKPNEEFFDYVFEKMKIKDRKEVLIIGDSLTSDIKGGAIAGIDACWFNPLHEKNTLNVPVTYEIDRLEKITDIV